MPESSHESKPLSERIGVVFSGRVQGVGFRATTKRVAMSFSVTGWVRNEPDGTVRAEFEGDPEQIDRCLEAISSAMPGHIDSVVCTKIGGVPDHIGGTTGFEIRR